MALTALQKIRKRANQMKREHPKLKDRDAIQKASKEYNAGKLGAVKKKTAPKAKTGTVKKAAPKRKTVIKTERLTTIGKAAPKRNSSVTSLEKRADTIQRNIDRLHKKVDTAKGKELKDFYKRATNAEYDKLSVLKKSLRA